MGSSSTPGFDWMDLLQVDPINDRQNAENILRSITKAFDQVHIATEFLLTKEEHDTPDPELQLACIIKDRMAKIEQQVSELYQIMSCPNETDPLLKH